MSCIIFFALLLLPSNSYQWTETWNCDKIKLPFEIARYSSITKLYGEYLGSCLRDIYSNNEDGVYIVCEDETFCGRGFVQSNVKFSHQQIQLILDKSMHQLYSCDVYVRIESDKSVGSRMSDKCDVIEGRLKEIWGDENDCSDVYCNSTSSSSSNYGAEICIDRFGFYECVGSTGKVAFSSRIGIKRGNTKRSIKFYD